MKFLNLEDLLSDILLELRFFAVSIICGIMLMFIYDIIRIFRRIINHNNLFISIEDVIFWIISAFIIFIVMYFQNSGIIRSFSIIAMIFGMILYNKTISKYFVNYISLIINKIIHIILLPFIFLKKIIKKIKDKLKDKANKKKTKRGDKFEKDKTKKRV